MTQYSILYRGPLSSCNYDCAYCPFAKRTETTAQLENDRVAWRRFLDWVDGQQATSFKILLTPWGEGLVRKWYRDGMLELAHLDHVQRVAIQTNLSAPMTWALKAPANKLAFWCSFHPTQVTIERFLEKCLFLYENNIRLSVGFVGLNETLPQAQMLRAKLPRDVYMWVNAFKQVENYYNQADYDAWAKIDPLFSYNATIHKSLGEQCAAGETVFSVDGDGQMTRCHFIKKPIGNIYHDNWQEALRPRTCSNQHCRCHIGYVHLKKLNLYEIFDDGVLERIPQHWPAMT